MTTQQIVSTAVVSLLLIVVLVYLNKKRKKAQEKLDQLPDPFANSKVGKTVHPDVRNEGEKKELKSELGRIVKY